MFKLRDAIKQKRRGNLSMGVSLLHDNAPVHKSFVAQQAIRDCGFVQPNHRPAYSPAPVPNNYSAQKSDISSWWRPICRR